MLGDRILAHPPAELEELGGRVREVVDGLLERQSPELRPRALADLVEHRVPERLQEAMMVNTLRGWVFRRYWSASTISMFGDGLRRRAAAGGGAGAAP
jgi:hypothetical protein